MPHHFSSQAKDLIKRMITADPISRITINQIKEHPWYKIELPSHLSIADMNQEFALNKDLLEIYRAYRFHNKIDEEIFNVCLDFPELQEYVNDKQNAKVNIIRRHSDPFTVTYEILLNTKLRNKRLSLEKNQNEPQPQLIRKASSLLPDNGIENTDQFIYLGDSNSIDETMSEPHNWNYCIRTTMDPYPLMCSLFDSFRECQLE